MASVSKSNTMSALCGPSFYITWTKYDRLIKEISLMKQCRDHGDFVKFVTAASVDHSVGKKISKEFLLLMEEEWITGSFFLVVLYNNNSMLGGVSESISSYRSLLYAQMSKDMTSGSEFVYLSGNLELWLLAICKFF